MEEKEIKFRYNDVTERYRRMNRVYIIASSLLWVMICIFMLFKLAVANIVPMTAYGNIVLSIVFAIVNAFFLLKG